MIPLGILAVAGAGSAAAGAYELISSTILTSTSSTITFDVTGLGATYKHLQIRSAIKTSRADTSDALMLKMNSDSGANYAFHRLRGNGSSVTSSAATSQTIAEIGNIVGNTTANVFAPNILDILDIAGTKNKTVRSFVASASSVEIYSALWMNTGALTSITLSTAIGPNFVSGSRFSIYGLKG